MDPRTELSCIAHVPARIAELVADLKDLHCVDALRNQRVAPLPTALVIICVGDLLEYKQVPAPHGDGMNTSYLGLHSSGSVLLMPQVFGGLRVRSKNFRAYVSTNHWRKHPELVDFALTAAVNYSRKIAEQRATLAFASVGARLRMLAQQYGIDSNDWSKQDLANWVGASREMVSRLVASEKKG